MISQVIVAVLSLTHMVQWDQRRLSHDLKSTALVQSSVLYDVGMMSINDHALHWIGVPSVNDLSVLVNGQVELYKRQTLLSLKDRTIKPFSDCVLAVHILVINRFFVLSGEAILENTLPNF